MKPQKVWDRFDYPERIAEAKKDRANCELVEPEYPSESHCDQCDLQGQCCYLYGRRGDGCLVHSHGLVYKLKKPECIPEKESPVKKEVEPTPNSPIEEALETTFTIRCRTCSEVDTVTVPVIKGSPLAAQYFKLWGWTNKYGPIMCPTCSTKRDES